MQQRRADAGAAEANLLARNLCHGDGVHDVGFAGETAHALMSLLGEVEGLVDDFGMLAVVGRQIRVYQVLIGLADHPLVFLFPKILFFHK